MAKHFYYLSEAAALLGWTKQWTGTQIQRGIIPAERVGRGRWRVRRVALRAFAEKHQITLDWDALQRLADEREAERGETREARVHNLPEPEKEWA